MPTTQQLYDQASHGLAGATYDADEENRPVAFEQDPGDDEGVGYWTYADGRRQYSRGDPEDAKALMAGDVPIAPAPAAEPEPEPAAPAAPEEDEDDFEIISGLEEESATAEQPAPQPSAPEAPAPVAPAPVAPQPAAPQPAGAKPVTEPIAIPETSRIAREHNNPGNLKFAGQAGAARGEKAADGGHWAKFETPEMGVAALRKQVDLDAGRGKTLEQFISGYAPPGSNDTATYVKNAAKALGARPDTPLDQLDRSAVTRFIATQESGTRLEPGAGAGPAPAPAGPGLARKTSASQQQSATQQTSQGANVSISRTGSAQPLDDFATQQQRIARGYDESLRQTALGTDEQRAAIARTRAALMQQAQDREAATSAAMAQRDARATEVKRKMKEVSERKVDINRTFKDRGVLGTSLGLLGVALRSRHATKFGGPNTALQQLETQRKLDIEAQVDDRNSELRSLERELGSLDAAVPVLEARMNDALAKRTQALMADERDATVLANGRDIVAKLTRERDEKLAEGARAYWGTLSRQEALSAQQSGTRSFGTEQSDTVAPGEGGAPLATEGPFPAVAEGLPEDESPEMRRGYASTFKPDDPRDRKEIADYGNGKRTLEKLKATRDKLRQHYGQPNESGEYKGGDYGSTATGSAWSPAQWRPNDARDRELIDAWTEVETNTRFDWKTEPNGQEMQNRLGNINVPKRDSDVPTKLKQLDDHINKLERSMDAETLPRVRAAYKLQRESPYAAEKTGGRRPGRIPIAAAEQ